MTINKNQVWFKNDDDDNMVCLEHMACPAQECQGEEEEEEEE